MLEIRPATFNDLEKILEIYLKSGLDDSMLDFGKAKEIFQKFSKYPDYQAFVAISNHQIVGTFAMLIMDNLAHLGTPSAIIEDVGVLPEFQNQGIGKQMMDFAMESAKQKGCYKMVLSSNQKRKNAHAFYEKLGFEKHGFSFKIDL